MADESTGILTAPPAPTPEEMGEAPAAPQQEQPAGPARDPSGRFQPKEPMQPQASEPEAAPQEPDDPRDKELKGMKAALAELRAELRQYKQPQQEQPKEPEQPVAPPDPDDDPIAYMKHVAAENERLKKAWEGQQQQAQVQALEAQAGQHLQAQLEAFKSERADVDDALSFAITAAQQRAAEAGIPADQAQQQIKQWLVMTTFQCQQIGVNPGYAILSKAKEFGYTGQPQPPAGASAQPPASVAAPTPRPPGPVSLSTMTGGAPNSGSVMNPMNMSYKEIGRLSEAEFAKINGVR